MYSLTICVYKIYRFFDRHIVHIYPPQEMFDSDVTKLKAGTGLFIDVLDTIGSLLLRSEVVGNSLENFKWEYEEKRNSENEIVIGDCNTSESFRLCQEEVWRKFPNQRVYVLYVIITTDKSELTKFGTSTTYTHNPHLYTQLFNVVTQFLCTLSFCRHTHILQFNTRSYSSCTRTTSTISAQVHMAR